VDTDRTYVFKLRKGVRWHPKPPVNGRELTADDVKYTYERFLSIKGNPNRSMLGHVEKIEALDRATVRFTLREPFGWFLDYLANTVMWIVPREASSSSAISSGPRRASGPDRGLAHSLRGGSPIADLTLYAGHIPGEALNSSGVDDPKLTDMIRWQRRTLEVAKRREIVFDIQRYLAEQVYYHYDPSVLTVAAWEPYVKNFAPNLGHDYGGRLMAAWLDR